MKEGQVHVAQACKDCRRFEHPGKIAHHVTVAVPIATASGLSSHVGSSQVIWSREPKKQTDMEVKKELTDKKTWEQGHESPKSLELEDWEAGERTASVWGGGDSQFPCSYALVQTRVLYNLTVATFYIVDTP